MEETLLPNVNTLSKKDIEEVTPLIQNYSNFVENQSKGQLYIDEKTDNEASAVPPEGKDKNAVEKPKLSPRARNPKNKPRMDDKEALMKLSILPINCLSFTANYFSTFSWFCNI